MLDIVVPGRRVHIYSVCVAILLHFPYIRTFWSDTASTPLENVLLVSDNSRTTTFLLASSVPCDGLTGSATDETSESDLALDGREFVVGTVDTDCVLELNRPENLLGAGPVGVASEIVVVALGVVVSTFQSLLKPHEVAAGLEEEDDADSVLVRAGCGGFMPTLFSSINARKAATHVSEASLASWDSDSSLRVSSSASFAEASSLRRDSSSGLISGVVNGGELPIAPTLNMSEILRACRDFGGGLAVSGGNEMV